MTQKWTIKDKIDGDDKNFVIFSLRSLGRSDILSLPAGSSRKNKRSENIKASHMSITFDGVKSKAAQVAPPKAPQKPKLAKPAKTAKAAKPASAGAKGAKNGAPKPAKPSKVGGGGGLKKPAGLPAPRWYKATHQEKLELIKTWVWNPPVPKSKQGVKPAKGLSVGANEGTKQFGPNDFAHNDIGSYYREGQLPPYEIQ